MSDDICQNIYEYFIHVVSVCLVFVITISHWKDSGDDFMTPVGFDLSRVTQILQLF